MLIGFDFDGVLSGAPHFEPIVKMIAKSHRDYVVDNFFVLTTRDEIDREVQERLDELFGPIFVPALAMGKFIDSGQYKTKAEYMVDSELIPDLFIDNDIIEIRSCYEHDIPCLMVPPIRKNEDAISYMLTTLFQSDFFKMYD